MASFADSNTHIKSEYLTALYPPNPRTARGVGTMINSHPTQPLVIYPSGKSVVVRNLEDVSKSFVYRGHAFDITVAQFSPSGAYVASADAGGKVIVWAWTNKEKMKKLDTQIFAGPIADLCWSPDNNKIVAVGDNGGGMNMRTFTFDTGNSLGEMIGHNKRVTTCSYKPTRPFKIMTGSEDLKTVFFAGPPFKMTHSNSNHTNFVNSVRFTPDGSHIVSVGSDKKIQLYDGTTGEPTVAVDNAHAGSIYQTCFSADGSKMLTVSADKSAKLWDMTQSPPVSTQTFAFTNNAREAAAQVGDMQVSCAYVHGLNDGAGAFLTLSLQGVLNVLDEADASPSGCKTVPATQSTYCAAVYCNRTNTVYGGDSSGCLYSITVAGKDSVSIKADSTDTRSVSGHVHEGQVTGLVTIPHDGNVTLVSCGFDDKVRFSSAADGVITSDAAANDLAIGNQPRKMASAGNMAVVLTSQNVLFIDCAGKALAAKHTLPFCKGQVEAKSVALSEDGSLLAVGGSDFKTHVYTITGGSVLGDEVACLETRSAVTALAFNQHGDKLAVGDAGHIIEVFTTADWVCINKGKWVFHTSSISTMCWDASGEMLFSGSIDEKLVLWDATDERFMRKTQIPLVHRNGVVCVGFKSATPRAAEEPTNIISVGYDGVTAEFSVPST